MSDSIEAEQKRPRPVHNAAAMSPGGCVSARIATFVVAVICGRSSRDY